MLVFLSLQEGEEGEEGAEGEEGEVGEVEEVGVWWWCGCGVVVVCVGGDCV